MQRLIDPIYINGSWTIIAPELLRTRSIGQSTDYHKTRVSARHGKHERVDYAMITNPKQLCPGACASGNPIMSPNGDVGIDAMINVMAHELAETVTDPELNAYHASGGRLSVEHEARATELPGNDAGHHK
ncbi:hypothetical protein BC937DRAFT_90607 [Endogone sp. FLAS-F59071]|nr:hypothetical protein BC937DRAFT_90607 [Endogone sp. FLAS-F59071]|eukprot:RUS16953.1 hypothetical protein BC937DRAFT_90607 [Endogone sp. FLAS-F59071]